MKNTTNWQLYNVNDSGKTSKKSLDSEIEDKELLRKLKLVEKAFK
ncbi:MAG: hypothetical protein QCH99_11330 [Candidatus Bathyarchaeota archaeon]|nr:hypothetical protein [Candidatus Bathyarchaeum tardum]WGM90079.1 MAG: hypothetical protein NUK63_02870 [Candidatus Bathyarchaeum tardum]